MQNEGLNFASPRMLYIVLDHLFLLINSTKQGREAL